MQLLLIHFHLVFINLFIEIIWELQFDVFWWFCVKEVLVTFRKLIVFTLKKCVDSIILNVPYILSKFSLCTSTMEPNYF